MGPLVPKGERRTFVGGLVEKLQMRAVESDKGRAQPYKRPDHRTLNRCCRSNQIEISLPPAHGRLRTKPFHAATSLFLSERRRVGDRFSGRNYLYGGHRVH